MPQGKVQLDYMQQALACFAKENYAGAELATGVALKRDPKNSHAWQLLGLIKTRTGAFPAAIKAHQTAVTCTPGDPKAHYHFGQCYQAMGRYGDAIQQYQTTLRSDKGFKDAWINLGVCHSEVCDLPAALAAYQAALALDPQDGVLLHNTADCLQRLGRLDEAYTMINAAITAAPDNPDYRYNRSIIALRLGKFEEGANDYEARFTKTNPATLAKPIARAWQGDKTRSLCVLAEQGIGNELMNLCFLPALRTCATQLFYECDTRLQPLINRQYPEVRTIPRGDSVRLQAAISDSTCQVASGSLAHTMGLTALPTEAYLQCDAALQRALQAELPRASRRVGLSWQTKNRRFAEESSVPMALWQGILSQAEIQYINLQYGTDEQSIAEFNAAADSRLLHPAEVDPLTDLERFAALCACCDTIIAVDNSTAVLSAALGIDTWVLAPLGHHYLWSWQGMQSSWLDKVRVFPQTQYGVWQDVLSAVQQVLEQGE